jgi:hypothetical protein
MKRFSTVFLIAGMYLNAQTGTGLIQGRVIDSTGKSVPTALISAIRRGLPPASQSAQASSGGTFSITKLTPGTYTVCVQVPGGGYLDPCDWTEAPLTLTLADGQTSAGNTVTLRSGSVVHITILDPNGLISQKTASGFNPHLMVGIEYRGAFHPARVAANAAGRTEFQVTIPQDNLVTLHVGSQSLALADSHGTALGGNAAAVEFQHATGDPSPPSFVFTVTNKLQ